MDLLFALKALGGVVGFSIGMVLGSLVSAIWLRLAAQWLRFGNIPYVTAFKCAILSNFVVFTLNFSIGVNHGVTIAMLGQVFSDQRSQSMNFTFAYSPIYFLCATIFGLLVTSAIFCRTIPNNDTDSRITFGDSLALASSYFALAFACMLLLGLLAFCIVTGFLAVAGA